MAQPLGQQLNLGPQPDFNNLIHHVNAAMGEVSRIPNLPLAGQGDVIIQLLQEIQGTIQEIQGDIQHIRAEQDLLPIKLFNSGAHDHEPIRYPQGVLIQYPLLPDTKASLSRMTGVECQAAATHLGLPLLPVNALVGDRRRQIAEHLGVPLR